MAENNKSYVLEAIIKAKDKVSEPMKKIADSISLATRQFKSIGKAASNFGGQLNKLHIPITSIGSAAIEGISRMTQSVASYGDAVANTSRRIGWSAKSLQEYQYASQFANMSTEEFTNGLETMSKNMGKLQAGTGPLVSGLENISPVLRQQIKDAKNSEEAFTIMMQTIQAADDSDRKRQLAELFFDNKNMVHFANLTAEELTDLRNKAYVLDDKALTDSEALCTSLTKIHASVTNLSRAVGSKLLPVITPFIDKVSAWIDANRELIATKADEYIKRLGEWLEQIDFNKILSMIEVFLSGIGKIISMLGGLDNAIIALVALISGPLISSFIVLTDRVRKLFPAIGRMFGGVNTLKKAFLLLKGGFKRLAGILLKLGNGIILLGKAFLVLGRVMLANPIILVITLIIGAIYLLYKNWDYVVERLASLWEWLKSSVMAAFEFFKKLFLNFTPLGLIIKNWEPIKEFFSTLWGNITEGISNAFNIIKNTIGKIVGWILDKSGIDTIMGLVDKVKNFFGGNEESDNINSAPRSFNSAESLSSQSPLISGAMAHTQAEVTVNLGELPKGSTVETKQSGAGMDLGVEYGFAIGVN